MNTKRYYLCPVVGDGKTMTTSYGAKLPGGVSVAAIIPSKPDGSPLFAWCLAHVSTDAAGHAAIAADATVHPLPAVGLEEGVPVAARPALATKLAAMGVAGVDPATVTLRLLLRAVGRKLLAGFDELQFGLRG